MVHLTERLGCALGFAGADLAALRWGAFLHDTGKVAIPDAILLKPGKLTPEEWDLIKRHPGIGFEMLHHIPSLPATTLEVVLYHQERWNGSGYPKGLEGTAIPLAARVFAVVDIYDALTSERPYKPAWSHEEAVAQLRKEAGVLLDARVVRTFCKPGCRRGSHLDAALSLRSTSMTDLERLHLRAAIQCQVSGRASGRSCVPTAFAPVRGSLTPAPGLRAHAPRGQLRSGRLRRRRPSAVGRPALHRLAGYAEDMVRLIDELDLKRITLMAASMSAMVGLLASLARPERFDALILISASPRYLNDAPYYGGFQQPEVDSFL